MLPSAAAQGALTVQKLADLSAHQPNYGLPPVVASLLLSTPRSTSSLTSVRITLQLALKPGAGLYRQRRRVEVA
jgi:hypothetical protein